MRRVQVVSLIALVLFCILSITVSWQVYFNQNRLSLSNIPVTASTCPTVEDVQALLETRKSFAQYKNKNILWGDSVVAGAQHSRDFKTKKYIALGNSGQTIQCAMAEMPYLIRAHPQKVIIYLGGNDADGQSTNTAEQAAQFYTKMVDRLLEANITPIIHLVHFGARGDAHAPSWGRDWRYVEALNQQLSAYAALKNISIIPAYKNLKFTEIKSKLRQKGHALSTDGEHLTPQGYKEWAQHIGQYVPDF